MLVVKVILKLIVKVKVIAKVIMKVKVTVYVMEEIVKANFFLQNPLYKRKVYTC